MHKLFLLSLLALSSSIFADLNQVGATTKKTPQKSTPVTSTTSRTTEDKNDQVRRVPLPPRERR